MTISPDETVDEDVGTVEVCATIGSVMGTAEFELTTTTDGTGILFIATNRDFCNRTFLDKF